MEKNSKGRYRIMYNIADQSETDYYVGLTVESKLGDTILTKALWVCNHYRGQMQIASEMGRGTRIELDIPMPRG